MSDIYVGRRTPPLDKLPAMAEALGLSGPERGRERIVPLQPELAEILGQPGAAGDPVAPRLEAIDSRRFARFLARCGVPAAGRTPHSCRHTYAGLMTATGVPGALLGAYLGHSSADTTAIYTKLAGRYAQAVGDWPRGAFRLR